MFIFSPSASPLLFVACLLFVSGCGSTDEVPGTATPTGTAAAASETPSPVPTPTLTPTAIPTPSGEGTLALRFRIDEDWMAAMMDRGEEPVGPVWVAVYHGYEVTNLGPDEGAELLAEIFLEEVDLTPDGGPTEVLFITDILPGEEVVVLGFMDSDDNVDLEDVYPDFGDPVTFPGDNRFDVVADSQVEAQVFFSMLSP